MGVGYCDTPLGPVRFETKEGAVVALEFVEAMGETENDPLGWRCVEELAAYFGGTPHRFSLPLQPKGTPFQRKVWEAVELVGHGDRVTYGELARRIGRPGAARAVGSAVGSNRIALLIPCHRVIGAGRNPGGYAWGLWRKRWLLEHEQEVGRELTPPSL